jgi:hypothetical protein
MTRFLWKNPNACLFGVARQADNEGVEVVENLSPEPVDRAMALVHDDEVEELDRQGGAIDDRGGIWSGQLV